MHCMSIETARLSMAYSVLRTSKLWDYGLESHREYGCLLSFRVTCFMIVGTSQLTYLLPKDSCYLLEQHLETI
jgi:hypothetical protein